MFLPTTFAVALVMTIGPMSSVANLRSASASNLPYAAIGGFIFDIANVLPIAGIEIVGLAVARFSTLVMAVLAVILTGKADAPGDNRAASRNVTRAMTAAHPLTPYGVAVLFTLGALICCFPFNVTLMRKPIIGEPLTFSGCRSAHATYGLLGGAVWGVAVWHEFRAA
jgi:glucose uptake protein